MAERPRDQVEGVVVEVEDLLEKKKKRVLEVEEAEGVEVVLEVEEEGVMAG